MHFTANRLRWIAVAILLAAFAVRAYNLGGTSLWFDEAVTVINSNHSFVEMIQRARGNNTTPIVLPTLWWLFGDSVHDAYTIRFLPLMFGLLAVALALRLPKVGVAKPAAAITAAWLAFLPVQIQYSQEAREYSLSVLGALLLLYGLLHALRMQQRFPTRLCIAVVLAPNLSYGLLFAATAALGTYAIAGVPTRRASAGRLLVLGGAFAGAALLSYVLLARDQMANAVAGGYNTYLASFFPTDGLVGHVEWLVTSLSGYFYYAFGGWIPALFGAAAIVVYAGGRLRRAAFSDLRVNDVILAAVIVVAAVTVLAAVAGRYPFGGNRQNLFATPWMICAAACAFVEIGARRTSARCHCVRRQCAADRHLVRERNSRRISGDNAGYRGRDHGHRRRRAGSEHLHRSLGAACRRVSFPETKIRTAFREASAKTRGRTVVIAGLQLLRGGYPQYQKV